MRFEIAWIVQISIVMTCAVAYVCHGKKLVWHVSSISGITCLFIIVVKQIWYLFHTSARFTWLFVRLKLSNEPKIADQQNTHFDTSRSSFLVAFSRFVSESRWYSMNCRSCLFSPFHREMKCNWLLISRYRLCSISFHMAMLGCAPEDLRTLRLCSAYDGVHVNWPLDAVETVNCVNDVILLA